MAKKYDYTFTINIFPASESAVDFRITAKERRLIMEAMEEGELFEDVEELSDLYERVMQAAKQQLEEDIDLAGDDIDIDNLEFSVEFGEEIEDD